MYNSIYLLTGEALETCVRDFMKILRIMALSCNTKEEFLAAKEEYQEFVNNEAICKKGGGRAMMLYLEL